MAPVPTLALMGYLLGSMRTVLRDRVVRALATLMFLLAPLPAAGLAARAEHGLGSRELAAIRLPLVEQAVLRDYGAAVHQLSDRRRGRGQPRPVLATAAAAAVLAGLVLPAVVGSRLAGRRPRRRAVAGPRAPPSPRCA